MRSHSVIIRYRAPLVTVAALIAYLSGCGAAQVPQEPTGDLIVQPAGPLSPTAPRPADKELVEAYAYYASGCVEMLTATDLDSKNESRAAQRHWRLAVAAFKAASERDPASHEIVHLLTVCQFRLGDRAAALAALERLSKLMPEDSEHLEALAQTYGRLGQSKSAIREYERMLDLAPEESEERSRILHKIATLYRKDKQPERALEYYDKVRESGYKVETIEFEVASCHAVLGDHRSAIDATLRFLRDNLGTKHGDHALIFLENQYGKADLLQEGAEEFARLLERDPDNVRIVRLRMLLLDRSGQRQTAIEQGETFLVAYPDAATVRVVLAQFLEAAKEFERAIKEYSEVLTASDPDSYVHRAADAGLVVVRRELALLHLREGEVEKAAEVIKPLMLDDVPDWRIKPVLARILKRADETDLAIRLIQDALEGHADEPEVAKELYFTLGDIYYEAEQPTEAEEALKKSLELDPKFAFASNYLGYMWAEQGRNLEEAVKLIKIALEGDPDSHAYLDSLAWAYYKQAVRDGDADKLIECASLLEKATAKEKDPVVLDHYGDVLYGLRQWVEASEKWREAIKHIRGKPNPNPELLRLKMSQVGKLLGKEDQESPEVPRPPIPIPPSALPEGSESQPEDGNTENPESPKEQP